MLQRIVCVLRSVLTTQGHFSRHHIPDSPPLPSPPRTPAPLPPPSPSHHPREPLSYWLCP